MNFRGLSTFQELCFQHRLTFTTFINSCSLRSIPSQLAPQPWLLRCQVQAWQWSIICYRLQQRRVVVQEHSVQGRQDQPRIAQDQELELLLCCLTFVCRRQWERKAAGRTMVLYKLIYYYYRKICDMSSNVHNTTECVCMCVLWSTWIFGCLWRPFQDHLFGEEIKNIQKLCVHHTSWQ